MTDTIWHNLGLAEALKAKPVTLVTVGKTPLAITWADGVWGAISSVCNHVGGPLGQGRLEGDYVVCPWHGWMFHRLTGAARPGFESEVPRHDVKEQDGRVWVTRDPVSARRKGQHAPHPLARPLRRTPGPVRVLGISTTAMDRDAPRTSTSELLLETALEHAHDALGLETHLLRLDTLSFRQCEGYYSKAAEACTWPCTITQQDPEDELEQVYEYLVHWADVTLVATPIRWGAASSLFYKMAERLNCVQNQVTIRDNVLIRNKVVGFIVTGGQDNVQGVAGQLLTFFTELGFHVPQFPFIAHSRGWSAEDMENNVAHVEQSEELRAGARGLVDRAAALARLLLTGEPGARTQRGGRKAHMLDTQRRLPVVEGPGAQARPYHA